MARRNAAYLMGSDPTAFAVPDVGRENPSASRQAAKQMDPLPSIAGRRRRVPQPRLHLVGDTFRRDVADDLNLRCRELEPEPGAREQLPEVGFNRRAARHRGLTGRHHHTVLGPYRNDAVDVGSVDGGEKTRRGARNRRAIGLAHGVRWNQPTRTPLPRTWPAIAAMTAARVCGGDAPTAGTSSVESSAKISKT